MAAEPWYRRLFARKPAPVNVSIMMALAKNADAITTLLTRMSGEDDRSVSDPFEMMTDLQLRTVSRRMTEGYYFHSINEHGVVILLHPSREEPRWKLTINRSGMVSTR